MTNLLTLLICIALGIGVAKFAPVTLAATTLPKRMKVATPTVTPTKTHSEETFNVHTVNP